MAIFGAPYSPGKDEERAVRAAVSMLERARALSLDGTARGLPPFQVGIGINTGEVVTGNIGSERRMEYTAIGDNVNVAFRLESIAPGGSVLITESVFCEIKDKITVEKMQPVTVKGREQPVQVYKLLGLRT